MNDENIALNASLREPRDATADAKTAPSRPFIEMRNISKRFQREEDVIERLVRKASRRAPPPVVHAVDDVSIELQRGEVIGLAGESGCGKSTLGRIVARLSKPSAGEMWIDGKNVAEMTAAEATHASLQIQMIFQDPFSSLNPRKSVGDSISEAPVHHGMIAPDERRQFVADQLRKVELDPAYASRLPHQFSGGQRQRIGIARALAVNPELLVCDESVAALDVSIQAQIINLFLELRNSLDLGYLFVSHDLGVIEHLSDRVVIMYLGRVVEEAPTTELFGRPNHPYTIGLLSERPKIQTEKRIFSAIKGEIPSPLSPPSGCHFHTRCPHVMERCRTEVPRLKSIATGHKSACHLND